MIHFINSNPGLKSRFNCYFYFKDYTPDELSEIFHRIAKSSDYILNEEAVKKINELFTIFYSKKDDKFGNARLARNIFEKTVERLADRMAAVQNPTRQLLSTIEAVDIPEEVQINPI